MAKKKTTEKALNIDNILFNCRDYLRAARNSGSFFEKRDMMLDVQKDMIILAELKMISVQKNWMLLLNRKNQISVL